MARAPSFLGRGWAFPPTFVRAAPGSGAAPSAADCNPCPGGVAMVEDETDIRQSLAILFATALGERVMQPGYGCNLAKQVFEPMNAAVLTFIEDLLRTAIVYHEPRIETDRLAVEPEQTEGRLRIEIDFRIRGTNSRFNFVFPYYLTETGRQP